jgi:hypothetical protein
VTIPKIPTKDIQVQNMTHYGIGCDVMCSVDVQGDVMSDVESEYHRSRYSRDLSPKTKEDLRLRVNERERDRMHDINGAMDALRQVRLIVIIVHIL